jgi:cytidylate kinase
MTTGKRMTTKPFHEGAIWPPLLYKEVSVVIQIRGTSGSGKTYIVNQLFKKYRFKKITQKGEIMGYYCSKMNLFIVGKYETACGGCDSIKTQDEICRRIRKGVSNGWNVLFEGLICSHIAARYAELYKELVDQRVAVKLVFLSTPLEKCRENINLRRAKKGKPPVFAKNTEKDYTSTHKSRENMAAMGVPVEDMPIYSSEKTLKKVVLWLKEKENKN